MIANEPVSQARPPPAAQMSDELRPAIERDAALALLKDARRTYEAAALVHERRAAGSLDSVPLAHRALAIALRILVRLAGEEPPDDFAELVERARAVNRAQSLLAEDPGDDLMLIAEMRERFLDYTQTFTPAEDRRYDRAFVRSGEVFGAVQAYLDGRLPSDKPVLRAYWKNIVAVIVALVLGLFVGTRIGRDEPRATATLAASESKPAAAAQQPGFTATFFKDKELREVAATRIDHSIAFDWATDAPPELSQADGFSARWEGRLRVPEAGQYTFHLTSDDGSRLFIDDKVVIDIWRDHSQITGEASVELEPGTHPIRVEYYDNVAIALVKLEWSSSAFARRVITRDDLR